MPVASAAPDSKTVWATSIAPMYTASKKLLYSVVSKSRAMPWSSMNLTAGPQPFLFNKSR